MKRVLFAAAALAATCAAAPAFAQDLSYLVLTRSDRTAVMVSTAVTGPKTDRRVRIVTIASEAGESGADNFRAEFSANCTTSQYRYIEVYGFAGDEKLGGGAGNPGWSNSEPGSLNDAAIIYACTGKRSSTDNTVSRGESAARVYGRSQL